MKIPLLKLKALLLYFSTHTNTKFLGKVKLMKLFYFLDFLHVKKYGSPVTYDNYVNLEHGPIPSAILNLVNSAIDDVDNSVLADTIKFERIDGIDMRRIVPIREFREGDKKYFSSTELNILEEICNRYKNSNANSIEEASHKESPWKNTRFLDTINYELASKDDDCVVSEEEIRVLMNI